MESLEALERQTGPWDLSADEKLLSALGDLSASVSQRSARLKEDLEELSNAAESASVRLQNGFNELLSLSNTQFIENRVQEDAEDDDGARNDSSKRVEGSTGEESFKQAFSLGLEALQFYVEVEGRDIGGIADGAIDIYNSRPLPFVIGTRAFEEDPNVGLGFEEEEDAADDFRAEQNGVHDFGAPADEPLDLGHAVGVPDALEGMQSARDLLRQSILGGRPPGEDALEGGIFGPTEAEDDDLFETTKESSPRQAENGAQGFEEAPGSTNRDAAQPPSFHDQLAGLLNARNPAAKSTKGESESEASARVESPTPGQPAQSPVRRSGIDELFGGSKSHGDLFAEEPAVHNRVASLFGDDDEPDGPQGSLFPEEPAGDAAVNASTPPSTAEETAALKFGGLFDSDLFGSESPLVSDQPPLARIRSASLFGDDQGFGVDNGVDSGIDNGDGFGDGGTAGKEDEPGRRAGGHLEGTKAAVSSEVREPREEAKAMSANAATKRRDAEQMAGGSNSNDQTDPPLVPGDAPLAVNDDAHKDVDGALFGTIAKPPVAAEAPSPIPKADTTPRRKMVGLFDSDDLVLGSTSETKRSSRRLRTSSLFGDDDGGSSLFKEESRDSITVDASPSVTADSRKKMVGLFGSDDMESEAPFSRRKSPARGRVSSLFGGDDDDDDLFLGSRSPSLLPKASALRPAEEDKREQEREIRGVVEETKSGRRAEKQPRSRVRGSSLFGTDQDDLFGDPLGADIASIPSAAESKAVEAGLEGEDETPVAALGVDSRTVSGLEQPAAAGGQTLPQDSGEEQGSASVEQASKDASQQATSASADSSSDAPTDVVPVSTLHPTIAAPAVEPLRLSEAKPPSKETAPSSREEGEKRISSAKALQDPLFAEPSEQQPNGPAEAAAATSAVDSEPEPVTPKDQPPADTTSAAIADGEQRERDVAEEASEAPQRADSSKPRVSSLFGDDDDVDAAIPSSVQESKGSLAASPAKPLTSSLFGDDDQASAILGDTGSKEAPKPSLTTDASSSRSAGGLFDSEALTAKTKGSSSSSSGGPKNSDQTPARRRGASLFDDDDGEPLFQSSEPRPK
eukprot:scaffold495_cov243-Pinguiococcus_pyrenoidosus.AAC.1